MTNPGPDPDLDPSLGIPVRAPSATSADDTVLPFEISALDLRGRVVLLHAFQMLCPGCVLHGLPQTQRVARLLAGTPLTVVGLHTVFEHHAVMGPEALAVFLAEHGYGFPVGIDAAGPTGDPLPRTAVAHLTEPLGPGADRRGFAGLSRDRPGHER